MKTKERQVGPPYDGGKYQNTDRNTLGRGLEAPFNWDIDLIEFYGTNNRAPDCVYPVRVLYGADRVSVTGNGRGRAGQGVREKEYAEYFSRCHDLGIEFHYLFNAAFLDGKEWDSGFRDELRRKVDELVGAGVDCLVLANPALAFMVKGWYPEVKFGTSVNMHLDGVSRVRQLLGYFKADTIMFDHGNSRDLLSIRALRREFPDIPIIVLVNESCLLRCFLQPYHQAALCSNSRCDGCVNDPDFCHLLCARAKLLEPINVLRAPWWRPEDLHHLFGAGATLVKLAGRTEPSAKIKEIVRAYSSGRFTGDIWSLVEKSGLSNPVWEEMLRRALPPCRFRVDNGALEGFIKPWVEGRAPCIRNQFGCGSCQWCSEFMGAVSLPDNRAQRLEDITELLAMCAKGDLVSRPEVREAA